MAEGDDELPPLIQRWMIDPDPVANARRIAAGEETIQDQIKRSVHRTQRIHDEAARRQVAGDRETARLVANIWKDALDKRERLALTTGKKVGDIEKASSREVVQQQEKSTTLMMRELKRYFAFNVRERRRANDRAAGEQARADQESTREQQRTNQRRTQNDGRTFKVLFAIFDDFLKRRRARERAQQYQDLAEQKSTHRQEWEEQKSANSRMLAEQKAAQRLEYLNLQHAKAEELVRHKAFWSIVRGLTETGSRFMASITKSGLQSMGNAVGYGLRGVLSRFKHGTDQQEDVLRGSYKQQEAITRGGLAQQEGAIAAFQTRANRGLIGTLFNLRNVLAGAGVYLGARAIFGPVMEYEQTQVAFENLLGSAEKAASLLSDLRAFNVATPFELPQIQNAAKQLLAMGETMQEVVPDLTAIGDVGAKFSASSEDVNGVIRALGQMSQSAKVSAQDINQIQQRFVGFNARAAIARGLGISVAEAMEKIADGSISGNEGMNAMIEGMKSEENAAGAMEEQMATLTGRLSNFKDLLNRILLDVMVPLLPVMQRTVEWFTSFIDSLVYGNGIFAVARSALMGIGIALGLIVAQEAAATVLEAVGQALKLIAANPLTVLAAAAVVLGTVLYRHNQDFRDFVGGFLGGIGDFVRKWSGPAVATLSAIGESLGKIGSAIAAADWGGVREMASSALGALTDMASNVAEFARPFAEALVAAVQYAFWSLQAWMDSGGMGRLRDMVADVWDRAWATIADLDLSRFVQPALIGLGAAIAYAIGGIPLLLVTALVAASPRIRDGLGQVLGTIGTYITEELPGVLLRAVEAAGRFLGGPFLATVLSKPVQTALFALVGVAVVAAGRFALGFIDGLRDSLPKIINATQELVESMLLAVRDALGDLPGVFDVALAPLGTLLLGIMPTIELFVNLLAHIPTPVIAAIAAFALMRHALVALQGSWAAQKLVGLIEWVQALPALFARAGAAVTAWGTNLAATQAQMLTATGGLSPVRTGLAGIGTAAAGAGGAITAMGAALPAIGIAAAVGLPLVLGMWQQSQAAARAHREEIQRNASAMLDLQTTARDLLIEIIRDSNGTAAAMNEAGITVDELYQSLDNAAEVGSTFAALMGQTTQAFADAGVDMTAFGKAVLDGNNAVSNYFDTLKNGLDHSDVDWQQHAQDITELQESYRDLDDVFGDAVVKMSDTAEAMLNQAAATGQLTDKEMRRLGVLASGETTTDTYIQLQSDVTDRLRDQEQQAQDSATALEDLRDWTDRARGATDLFKQSIDALNGNQLDLSAARLQIEEVFAALDQTRSEGGTFSEMRGDFIDASQGIVDFADTLLNNKRPITEVVNEFQRLRDNLVDQVEQFGYSEQAASNFLETLGLPPEFIVTPEMRTAVVDNQIQLLSDRLTQIGAMDLTPEVELLYRGDTQRKIDALNTILNHPPVVEMMVQAQVDFAAAGFSNSEEIAYLLADVVQHAKGGLVTRPEFALIGEAGPELILPLSDPKRMAELLAQNASSLASAMPAVTATAPPATVASSVVTAAPTVNTEGIAAWIAATAAALAPLGETIALATAPGFEAWYASIDSVLTRIDARFKAWGGALTVAASSIGAGVVSALTVALQSGSGEVTSIVRGFGHSLVGALNPLLTGIGEPAVTLAYAKGGIAEAHAGPQVHVFNEGKRGRGSSHGEAYIPFDPSNRSRSRNLATETVRRLGGDVQWFANGGLTADAIRRGQSFARAQDGKPYSWGAVGPSAYDCSGLASAIINAVRGQDPYHRLFTSGSLVAGVSAGLIPGLGQVSVGARPGSPGHVSTTIAGLNAEATGDHVRIGAAAASAADFPSKWHLGSGVFIGPDGTTYPLPVVPAVTGHGLLGRTGSGWMRYVLARSQSFVDANTYTGMAFTGNEFGVPAGMQGGGGGSPEVMAAIRRAMSIVGVPASWLGPLLTLISRESGFNPRAYNGQLGASGLMQTIPSTFANHALPGFGGIFDPLANVIAGLRYILSRYGSIFNVGQAVSASPTHGYSYGGVVERDGMYRLSEGNRREVVLPLENRGRLLELLRRTGLDKTIAMASGVHPDNGLLPVGSATSLTSPSLGPVVGEMNVYSNATDPEAVGTIAANKVDRQVRSVLTGVGSL